MGTGGEGRSEDCGRMPATWQSRAVSGLRILLKAGAAVGGKVSDAIRWAIGFAKRAPWKTLAAAVFTVVLGPLLVGVALELLKPVVGPDEGGTTASPSPSTEGGSAPNGDGTPPVEVLSVEVSHSEEGDLWASPEPIRLDESELAELDRLKAEDRQAYAQRMRAYGAGEVGQENIRVILRGARPEGARIMQMRAERECGPPDSGTLFYSPDAGLDPVESAYFDLDSPDPVAQRVDEFNEPVGEFFAGDTYQLEQGEEVVFDIIGATQNRACEFTIGLDVLADGDRSTVSIDDEGMPFRVSGRAPADAYEAAYVGGVVVDGAWHRVDEEIVEYDPWAGYDE
ncbi:hypothetical protein [Nocardiopsis suaedae]|uniref:Uncharacterized protein n=1 Tax=Nocardiopsis suaedae TaxID=3018444 RepID=A0ABT4TTG4_9ACTN|nr:hypothetical protein [Nocardiopsis suaedae]MDA2807991.1 hypothetical protein [Nocardiopsis suaedae]